MRLVGGPNEFEGCVEVYLGGVWARLCRPNSGVTVVACRQLGHEGELGDSASLIHQQIKHFPRW